MRSIKGFDPNSVAFSFEANNRARIRCVVGDFRYHVWVDPKTLELVSPILYKNSTKRVCAPRKLDVTVKHNAALFSAMQKAVNERGLVAAEHARRVAEDAQQRREIEDFARLTRIRDAAVPLYEALKGLIANLGEHRLWAAELKQAKAAVKLAEKGNAVNTVQPGELA